MTHPGLDARVTIRLKESGEERVCSTVVWRLPDGKLTFPALIDEIGEPFSILEIEHDGRRMVAADDGWLVIDASQPPPEAN